MNGSRGWGRRSSGTPRFRREPTWSSRRLDAPDRVRIRIWERGVGPTESSGTGACAAAIAAIAHVGAARGIGRGRTWRRPARRVDRRWPLPDRLGRAAVGRDLACRPLTRRSTRSRAARRRRSGSTGGAAPSDCGSRRRCCSCCWRCHCPSPVAAHRMAAILGLVVVLWMTEALPMAVTAMLGPILAVIFGVADARSALAPFADPIIFLFIGSFILAEAMFVHGVDRRIAFTALSSPFVGSSAHPRARGVCRRGHGDLDVDQQHGDNSHDVSDRVVDRESPDAGGTARRSLAALGAAVRARTDAPHIVWRVGRRNGDARGYAAEFDWYRHARPHRERADLLLSVDGSRAADRGAAVRVSRCALLVDGTRPAGRGGQWRPGARRAPAPWAAIARRAQRPRRVRRDGGALGGAGPVHDWRMGADGIRAWLCPGDARRHRGHGRRDAALRAAGGVARAPLHYHVGSGCADRLGHRAALWRRPGDWRPGVLDRVGGRARARHHGLAARRTAALC